MAAKPEHDGFIERSIMSVDLSQLPPPEIIESLDYERIYADRKRSLISKWPIDQQAEISELLEIESEPLTKLLQENAYRELLLRQRINEAVRAVLVSHTTGSDADNLFAFYGVERKEGELDDAFRERSLLALHALSTAGPSNAYRHYALSVPGVSDAQIERMENGFVRAWILSKENDAPAVVDQALVDSVQSVLSADDVRPLSDTVVVQAAVVEHYKINATIFLDPSAVNNVDIERARLQLDEYVSQQFKIGGQVSASGIYAALHQPGVRRVDMRPAVDLPSVVGVAYYCAGIRVEVAS